MAREVTFSTDKNTTKTYATKANLERAITKAEWLGESARYFIHMTEDGRLTPVFLLNSLPAGAGAVWCAQHGWNVVG